MALPSERFLMRWAAQSAWIWSAGHAPHLLGVGLEEDAVQAPAEARRRPALERGHVLRSAAPAPRRRSRRTSPPRPGRGWQRVPGPQGVVVELAAVVDAAQAGPQQEVVLGQDLVPERLDLGHLGEEAVAADVEAPAVALDGAADAADDVVGFEHGGVDDAGAAQLVGRGEPRRAGTDDDDLVVSHGGPGHRKRTSASARERAPSTTTSATASSTATNARRWAGSNAVTQPNPGAGRECTTRATVNTPARASPPTAPPVRRTRPRRQRADTTMAAPTDRRRAGMQDQTGHQRAGGRHGDGHGPRQPVTRGRRTDRPAPVPSAAGAAPAAADGPAATADGDQHDAGGAGHGRQEEAEIDPALRPPHERDLDRGRPGRRRDEPPVGAAVHGPRAARGRGRRRWRASRRCGPRPAPARRAGPRPSPRRGGGWRPRSVTRTTGSAGGATGAAARGRAQHHPVDGGHGGGGADDVLARG